MPFENVHGNGGLLTTVGDLLKWNENFVTPKVGDAAFVKIQQEPGQAQRRQGTRLCARPRRRPVQGSAGVQPQRLDRRLSRAPDALSGAALVGGRALQRQHRQCDAVCAERVARCTWETRSRRSPRRRRSVSRGPRRASQRIPKDLAAYAGRYYSDEAEVVYEVAVDGDASSSSGAPMPSSAFAPPRATSSTAPPEGSGSSAPRPGK